MNDVCPQADRSVTHAVYAIYTGRGSECFDKLPFTSREEEGHRPLSAESGVFTDPSKRSSKLVLDRWPTLFVDYGKVVCEYYPRSISFRTYFPWGG